MISIVIPLYNKEKTIERCIKSALNQSFKDIECIVIDDGSSDRSASIVKQIKDSRIRYIYQTNQGVSAARNKGVAESLGEWILFLDADDILLNNACENLLTSAKENGLSCAAGNFFSQYKENKILHSYTASHIVSKPFKEWYKEDFCPRTGSAIFRKEILLENNFDERLQRYEDAASLFEIMRYHKFAYNSKPVMIYTDDCKGLSGACKDISRDFIFHIDLGSKKGWEKLVLLHLLNEGLRTYPQHKSQLKDQSKANELALFAEKFIFFITRCMRKIQRGCCGRFYKKNH